MKKILNAKNVSKTYGTGSGKTAALNNVSFDIYEGELLVIFGNSGSGKSTLLNMIGGMDKPDNGSIIVNGEDICLFNDKQLTDYRRDNVGFVFQSYNLIQELSARENVALSADFSLDKEIADKMLDLVGLTDKRHCYPSQLSGGEQQRVSIARALAKKSLFLLCDEPTGALDYETAKQVLASIENLVRKHHKTVVLVTHTSELGKMADRTLRLKNGEIVEAKINDRPMHVSELEW